MVLGFYGLAWIRILQARAQAANDRPYHGQGTMIATVAITVGLILMCYGVLEAIFISLERTSSTNESG